MIANVDELEKGILSPIGSAVVVVIKVELRSVVVELK